MPNHQGIISNAIKGAPARSGQPQLADIQQPLKNTQAKNTGSSPQLGNVPSNNASQYKAPKVAPVTTEVNKTGTVESRLNNLTAKGSRYTNLAAEDARRNANSRGLINSSMAAAAGTEAAIRSALPIAQQDAKTYNDNRLNNQGVQNKFLENRQGANLSKEVAAQGSNLKKSEMRLGDTIQQGQNAQNANLNIKVNTAQSALTNQENTILNDLMMKRDSGLSTLTQAEQAQLNALQIKRDSAQSGNIINQQNNQSGLTQQENAQLNALQMKRDQGLSTLTQQENTQLNDLTMKRDAALSQQTMQQNAQTNQLNINRDNNSAALNQSLSKLENTLLQSNMKLDAGLKLSLEKTLQDGRFSDQVKINAMNSIENIYTNLQSQITQIGLSDRTAAQQASAIDLLQRNAAAETKTYQALLTSSPGWTWGGTPGNTQNQPPPAPVLSTKPADVAAGVANGTYTDIASVPGGGRSFTTSVGGSTTTPISEDLKWSWNPTANTWEPYDQSRNVHTGQRTYQ